MFVLASVSSQLVDFATKTIDHLGLAGVFVLMTLESACIPIPSEATMLFAGFDVSSGHWSLITITLVGTAGNLVGSWIAYAVGYFGRIELLEKHGRVLHITPAQLQRADRWFERYGAKAVFFSRMLPVVRTFISLPAGVARMPFLRFTVLTVAGCLPWVLALGALGDGVGHNWHKWKDNLAYLDYAIAALIVIGIVYLVVRRVRRRREGEPAVDASG
ncbi:MAG: DedA family protein [Solirubrobacterales bacterium]|jgi:membrane protein DedA with SNARE-associated domain|nr:DedA family protein [Solirubrobacterales bacterium]